MKKAGYHIQDTEGNVFLIQSIVRLTVQLKGEAGEKEISIHDLEFYKAVKLTEQECEDKIKSMLYNNQSIVIVLDNDDYAWESGWADFLSRNYNYSNLNSAFRVNLEKPKAITI